MANERWAQIERLFHVALESPVSERGALLAQECAGDEALRREVESLLAEHEQPNSVFALPAAALAADWMGQQAAAQPEAVALIGQQLRHYQILSVLGKGGMGEVYLAEDTQLDRRVALKLLPVGLTTDADRLRRFVREAKAVSARNHPNIITIHEIGETTDERGTLHFLVTEYIEGETLRERMSPRRLTLAAMLDISLQLAAALASAHKAGIVHRDIKPENVMLRRDGIVKVLDFGLAKLTERKREGEKERKRESVPPSLPPSVSPSLTNPGLVMGTAHYMSPEQARGQQVDVRTDIFSFGVLLYEMIAGRPPFEGVNAIEVMGAILHQEPLSLSAARSESPDELQARLDLILQRALRKDCTERYPTIDALRDDLKAVQHDFEAQLLPLPLSDMDAKATVQQQAASTNEAFTAHTTTRLTALLHSFQRPKLALALLLLVLGGAAAYRFLGQSPANRADASYIPIPFTGLSGLEDQAAFSHDGKQVAFSWDGGKGGQKDIYVKLIGVGEPLQLTRDLAEDGFPVWSPDGRYIAFQRRTQDKQDRREIVIVPALGGAERLLCTVGEDKIAWSPDGKWLAAGDTPAGSKDTVIVLISVETGEKQPLTHPPVGIKDRVPAFSPDGQQIVFVRASVGNAIELYLVSINGGNGGKPRQLTTGSRQINGADWTADGKEIIYASTRAGSSMLWRLPVAGGEPLAMPGVGWGSIWPTVARQGGMLAFTENYNFNNILRLEVPAQRPGKQSMGLFTPLIVTKRGEHSPQISPDARTIAFISTRSGSPEIWLCDRDGRNQRQLTQMRQAEAGSPRWSPDSQQLVFDARPDLSGDLFIVNASGGTPRRLTSDPSHEVMPSWSSDGKWIYFCSNRGGSDQIWKMPSAGGPAVQMTREGGFEALESPDGKTVYYSKDRGVDGLWSVPSASGPEQPVPELAQAGYWRAWAVTAEGIYYIAHTGPTPPYPLNFFHLTTRQTRQVGLVEKTPVRLYGSLTAAHDGQWLLYAQPDRKVSTLMLVENFR